ncbi:O-antigen ligase family protein [Phaeocystidibacter marisrubri]|uniref:O-antigen ligase family protein n=2 Tax=Phaeocystidibacter marisrubri TaxID=1577780 RepID=A0A6L3ZGQ3_9FLAO|nr:O-antigen ligase family protein [Phaeocystidibacter marisrubri]
MTNSFLHRIKSWRTNTKLRERSTEFVLSAFVVLLPFQWKFPPISLMIMLLGVVFLFFIDRDYLKNIRSNLYFKLILAYYAWVAIGLTYTDFPKEGGADLQVQISLLAWPLGLAALNVVNQKMIDRLTMLFVRAMGVSVVLCLMLATFAYLEDGNSSHFFYKNLSAWPLVPQHYMGMYVSFAIIILIFRWFFKRKSFRTIEHIELYILIALFLLTQGLLSVRNQFIAFPLAILPLLLTAKRKHLLTRRGILKGLGIGAVLLAVIAILPGTQRRIIETYHELRSINHVVDKKQTNHRIYLWKYASETIGENWLLGTGTGGGNAALRENLKDCDAKYWDGSNVYYLYQKEYNAHNVFLQAWMTHGIIGFLLIVAILFIPLVRATKRGDILTSGFIILATVSFLTESMLERQAGVMWFAVFYALLVVAQRNEVTLANKNTPANLSK